MRPDLHTHTHYSDGNHSPRWVMDRARDRGVDLLALTDHDCLEGYLELAGQEQPADIHLIAGVEISTLWNNHEIHVLGLCVDPRHGSLETLLRRQQERRVERLGQFDALLVRAGITGLADFVATLPSVAPGRAHVARFLTGHAGFGAARKAFRALARNGRFHVQPRWCALDEAIAIINAAGGIAVLAHPHRYGPGRKTLERLLNDFRQAGGEAMEVGCANLPSDIGKRLATLSVEHELWVSVGTDFHSSEATWMDLGKLAPLPEQLIKNAIWLHPGWH
jgi:predicted metal-dependent phosphoesterase TrpH